MPLVSSFDVTLDTCVLLPITLCDTLLRFAEAGFYRPHWSRETLDELYRHLVTTFGLPEAAVRRRVDLMYSAFPEALVEGYEVLVPAMPTPDPNDRHVLAAAVRSASQVIVTSNLKDFPTDALVPLGVDAQSPDTFLLHQCNLDAQLSSQILRDQAAEKNRPPLTPEEILDRLANNAPEFAASIRALLAR